jgi:hypothetical protein
MRIIASRLSKMDFIRPAYLNPAEVPESIRKKIPWMVEVYEEGLDWPAPKPTSREDGVYCVWCAMWDIDGQSRHYKPKPRSPKLQPHGPLDFRYDPGFTNFSRLLSSISISDHKEESIHTATTSLINNQASDIGVGKSETEYRLGDPHQASYHELPSKSAEKGTSKEDSSLPPRKPQYIEPALNHDSDPFDGNPVYVNDLALVKIHQHFCRLCHLLLNSLDGCPELVNPPWGDETMVYVDRFEFASLYDDDKIREDAESRPKPGWPGFDASPMGILHRHSRLREAKADALPERLSYRFCVRLDNLKHPSLSGNRRFGIQRLGELPKDSSNPQFCGLQGRLVGSGEARMKRWLKMVNVVH